MLKVLLLALLQSVVHIDGQQDNQQLLPDEFTGFGPGPEIPHSVMDPSTFTPEVCSCQHGCGDSYFTCSFVLCDRQLDSNTKPIHKDPPTQRASNSLLSILTFGLLDNPHDSKKAEEESDEKNEESDKDWQVDGEACFKDCVQAFRDCYNACVCRFNLGATECIPTISPRIAGHPIPPRIADEAEFKFNWNKFSD